jgi:hypothetical protein
VFENGNKLPTNTYTATSGTTVVLNDPVQANDVIEILSWQMSGVQNAAPLQHTHAYTDITGLGSAATRNVGTAAGTVAAGDDARITGALQTSGLGAATFSSYGGVIDTPALQALVDTLPAGRPRMVEVPGNATPATQVVPQGRDPYYLLDPGATVSNYAMLGGRLYRPNKVLGTTFGTFDNAAVFSVMGNPSTDRKAQVMGFSQPSGVASYPTRDSVAVYVDNRAPPPVVTTTGTFTATTATPTTPFSADQLARFRIGMLVDTSDGLTGDITGWATDGTSLTVSAWYAQGDTSAGQVPVGTTMYVNPISKIWGLNLNVFTDGNSYGDQAAGIELGTLNTRGDYNPSTGANTVWGYDAVNLGAFRCAAGFIARGNYFNAFDCEGASNAGFHVKDNVTRNPAYGFLSEQTTGQAFGVFNGAQLRWSVAANGSMAVGSLGSTDTPKINFRSSGNGATNTYDAQIIASGGTTTTGQGSLAIDAATLSLGGTTSGNEALRVTKASGGNAAAVSVLGGATNANPRINASSGNLRLGAGSALATTATTGFVVLPEISGTPTAAPTNAGTGGVAMAVDPTAGKIWCYVNGAWKSATLA